MLASPRFYLKPLFPEVSVETERGSQTVVTHGLKADAVNQAQLPSRRGEQGLHGGAMLVFRHPFDSQQRSDIFVKGANCRHGLRMVHITLIEHA